MATKKECDTCGGQYTSAGWRAHEQTKRHQGAELTQEQTRWQAACASLKDLLPTIRQKFSGLTVKRICSVYRPPFYPTWCSYHAKSGREILEWGRVRNGNYSLDGVLTLSANGSVSGKEKYTNYWGDESDRDVGSSGVRDLISTIEECCAGARGTRRHSVKTENI